MKFETGLEIQALQQSNTATEKSHVEGEEKCIATKI